MRKFILLNLIFILFIPLFTFGADNGQEFAQDNNQETANLAGTANLEKPSVLQEFPELDDFISEQKQLWLSQSSILTQEDSSKKEVVSKQKKISKEIKEENKNDATIEDNIIVQEETVEQTPQETPLQVPLFTYHNFFILLGCTVIAFCLVYFVSKYQ